MEGPEMSGRFSFFLNLTYIGEIVELAVCLYDVAWVICEIETGIGVDRLITDEGVFPVLCGVEKTGMGADARPFIWKYGDKVTFLPMRDQSVLLILVGGLGQVVSTEAHTYDHRSACEAAILTDSLFLSASPSDEGC